MAEFKIGDKVVRKDAFQDSTWSLACARNDRTTDGVFVIDLASDDDISVEGLPGYWEADCFTLAILPQPHPATELPDEDRLRESDAHIECLRDLLEAEKQQVGNLLALNNVLVDQAARLQEKIAELKTSLEDVNRALGAVSIERDFLKHTINNRVDERDATVAAAKSLGEDLRIAREEVRWARFTKTHLSGLCDALFTATADIDLSHVASQLRLLAQMCEGSGNGADAALAYDAAQVVELTAMTLASLDEVQEYAPSHFPPMEGPLA